MSDIAIQVLRAVVQSRSVEGFFEKLSSNLWGAEPIRGFQVYVPEGPGELRLAHQYTQASINSPLYIDLSGTSCGAKAFNSRQICRDPLDGPVLSSPIGTDGLTTGVFCLHLSGLESLQRLGLEELTCIEIGVAAFLNSNANAQKKSHRNQDAGVVTVQKLSDRQNLILQLMKTNQTYYQIARELHVSESLVKLEVSRIFRFLGVATKADAIRVGGTPPG